MLFCGLNLLQKGDLFIKVWNFKKILMYRILALFPSPPPYITLDRSDGVQTTAPPSLPTQLEGLGSQLHDLQRWCTLYHTAATLHAA